MLHFRIAIHGRPSDVVPGPIIELMGRRVTSVAPTASGKSLSQAALPVTFEAAESALTRLPCLYFEPDGSFGWFSPPGAPRWELGGMLYDRGDRVMYAELEGSCTAEAFQAILDALGGGPTPLLVQLLEQAVFLEAEEFRRLLQAAESSTS